MYYTCVFLSTILEGIKMVRISQPYCKCKDVKPFTLEEIMKTRLRKGETGKERAEHHCCY